MIFAIGDIHGRADMLVRLLDELKKRKEQGDLVVFLGDYIDRGPQSKQVVDLLMQWKQEHKNTVCLLGNHEQMLIDCIICKAPHKEDGSIIAEGPVNGWMSNGGFHTLKSYGVEKMDNLPMWKDLLPQSHIDFFLKLKPEHKTENWHFVHAGLPEPGIDPIKPGIAGGPPYDHRLWARDEFINSETDFGRRVVFGHTVQDSHEPLVMRNKIGIDTGCVFGGPLTCLYVHESGEGPARWFQIHDNVAVAA